MLHTGNVSSRWLTIHNPPLFARKTSLRLSSMATLVTPSNVLTVFGCCGSDRSIRRTVSVGRLAALGANAAAVAPDLRSGTKAIANADPDGGKLMFPPVGSGKAFRSSRTGLAAFVTSTIAKAFLSALRRNRYPFSPVVVGVSVSPAFLEDPGVRRR